MATLWGLLKNGPFWASSGKYGLLFIPASGHTGIHKLSPVKSMVLFFFAFVNNPDCLGRAYSKKLYRSVN